jgi:dCTP deaminase
MAAESMSAESPGRLLGGERLRERLRRDPRNGGIVIAPLLELTQVERVTVDVRLGTEFQVSLHTRTAVFDPSRAAPEGAAGAFFERTFRDFGESFVLYPDHFVLGCSFEYLRLPLDVCAEINGRSSVGRAGFAIRGFLQPGYMGVLTLELTNGSGTTVVLEPGMRVAQLTFFELDAPTEGEYFAAGAAKYLAATGPQVSRVAEEGDWSILRRMRLERGGGARNPDMLTPQ